MRRPHYLSRRTNRRIASSQPTAACSGPKSETQYERFALMVVRIELSKESFWSPHEKSPRKPTGRSSRMLTEAFKESARSKTKFTKASSAVNGWQTAKRTEISVE